MNELQIFKSNEFGEVRTLNIDGEPWFVGKDVASVLGYTDTFGALKKHVDSEDKQNCQNDSFKSNRGLTLINESGLYSLILSSKLPQAKAFKRWVTSEVLPAIRKHGLYAVNEILENPDMVIAALTKLKEERELRKTLALENAIKDQQIAELKPKATYYDLVLQCNSLLSVTEIAKDYGMSATKFNKVLKGLGVQYKQSGVWFLYAKYQGMGYTSTKTQNYNRPDGSQGSKVHMYWTQNGRLFLYYLLKEHDILPVIEKEISA